MINLFYTSKSCYQLLYSTTLATLCCFLLIGCSGGISGTGDGGTVIGIDPSIDSNTRPSSSGDSVSTIPPVFTHQVFAPQLITNFSAALLNANDLDDNTPDLPFRPVSQKISEQLNTLTQQSIQVQLDIANIEELLLDVLEQCDSTDICSDVPSAITTTLSPDTLAYQQLLQPQSTGIVGEQTLYNNVLYSRETAGYFDQKLQYTNQSGTRVVLQWTTDNQLVSLVARSNTTVTYFLTDFQQATTTLRIEDKAATTVFHAVLNGTAAVGTTIEADLHGDQEHYVRATADETSILLFAVHPTDSTIMPTREAFNLLTGNYAVESCTVINTTCEGWQLVASDGSTIGTRLTAVEATLGDFSLTISSNLQVTVPAEVNEFVIANDNGIEQPATLSLVCSGQRVLTTVRSFCWQPLPLADTVKFYEEVLDNDGNFIIRLLPDARVR